MCGPLLSEIDVRMRPLERHELALREPSPNVVHAGRRGLLRPGYRRRLRPESDRDGQLEAPPAGVVAAGDHVRAVRLVTRSPCSPPYGLVAMAIATSEAPNGQILRPTRWA